MTKYGSLIAAALIGLGAAGYAQSAQAAGLEPGVTAIHQDSSSAVQKVHYRHGYYRDHYGWGYYPRYYRPYRYYGYDYGYYRPYRYYGYDYGYYRPYYHYGWGYGGYHHHHHRHHW